MTKTSLFTLASLAFVPSLMAIEPLPQPQEQAVEIEPKIAICRMPAPASNLKQLKDMEANEDAIQSILQNEEAKTAVDKLNTPIVLKSMEDALKHLTRASMEKIEVDFETQQVVIFAWQGSGQDRLHGYLPRSKDAVANFNYTEGMTEDLRTHSFVYSMPKGTELKVNKRPRVIRCGVGLNGIEPQVLPNGQKLELKIEPQQLQDGIQLRLKPQKQAK